jgi:hypothetical protein
MMSDVPAELVEAFRRLGVRSPEAWASSQVREGIQLARASLLYWFWSGMVGRHDLAWVDDEIAMFRRTESRSPGRGAALVAHGPVLERLLALGVTREEITTLVRGMQSAALFHCCAALDGSAGIPEEVKGAAVDRFGVFELDEHGKPVRRVPGLHESVVDFDVELNERKQAFRDRSRGGKPNGGRH